MAVTKVREYLRAHAGEEIGFDELLAANVALSKETLHADLSRLVADPKSGVRRLGNDTAKRGVRRSYIYNRLVDLRYIKLLLIGSVANGNGLAEDETTGRIFEIVPAGRLDRPIRQ